MAAAPHPPRTLPIVAIALAVLPGSAGAFTWNIYENRTGDATTIQVAMTQVAAGDSVLVWEGLYDDGPIDVPSDVTLVSQAGAEKTWLVANGPYGIAAGRDGDAVNNVVVAGFTITGVNNGGLNQGRALDVNGNVWVFDCIVRNNEAIHAGGHLRSGDLRIYDTVFRDNLGIWGPSEHTAGLTCTRGYLVLRGCTFENLDVAGTPLHVEGGTVDVRECIFRNCNSLEIDEGAGSVVFFDNLFDRVPYPFLVLGAPPLRIVQNTFARAGRNRAALGPALGGLGTVIERNVLTGGYYGLWLCCEVGEVACNVAWGNQVDWEVPFPVDGVDGNFSAPPGYCDSQAGDFTVGADSPLLPGNNTCGQQIGAFGSGCAATPVETSSFGAIKARYRR